MGNDTIPKRNLRENAHENTARRYNFVLTLQELFNAMYSMKLQADTHAL